MLTERLIQKLEVTGRDYQIKDSPNLYVRVSPQGTKSWRIEFSKNGENTKYNLGSCDQIDPSEARELTRKARRLVALGIKPTKELLYAEGEEDESKLEDFLLDQRLKIDKEKLQEKQKSKDYKIALERIQQLEEELSFYKEVSAEYKGLEIVEPAFSTESLDVPVIDLYTILSDVHPGKRITLEQTLGKNEYNPEIASQRLTTYWENLCYLINMHAGHSEIRELNVIFGGDMIENRYMHSQEATTATMSASEELCFMVTHLTQGLTYLKEYASDLVGKINVICITGNHDRMPNHRRVPASNRVAESLANILYHMVAENLKSYPKFDFVIPLGEAWIQDSFGFRTYITHGDGFNYSGGIGGLEVPLKKFRLRMQQAYKIDCIALGHWHTLTYGKHHVVSGSTCGYDSYAVHKGFEYERPCHVLWAVSKAQKAACMHTPIWVN